MAQAVKKSACNVGDPGGSLSWEVFLPGEISRGTSVKRGRNKFSHLNGIAQTSLISRTLFI